MRIQGSKRLLFVISCLLLLNAALQAQQLNIRDFVLFGKDAVQFGSSNSTIGGRIGTGGIVRSSGTGTFNSNMHSNGTIDLTNSSSVKGSITAANAENSSATVIRLRSNAFVDGNISSEGNIVINSGSVSGTITTSGTYVGPNPSPGAVYSFTQPSLPTLPQLGPPLVPNAGAVTTTNVTGGDITPGTWGSITLTGSKTVTFRGAGDYVFDAINNSGNSNRFVFDFKGETNKLFRIFVKGDAALYKISIDYLNLRLNNSNPSPSDLASRILMQVLGDGATQNGDAWTITNGASGNNQSTWLGTVIAYNGNIDVGNGSSESKIVGALISAKSVFVQSGVSVTYSPLLCTEPAPVADAGPAKSFPFPQTGVTIGGANTVGTEFKWTTIRNCQLEMVGSTRTVTATMAGIYTLEAYNSCGIMAASSVTVTYISPFAPINYNPCGKEVDLIGTELRYLSQNIEEGKNYLVILGNDTKVLIEAVAIIGYEQQARTKLLAKGLTDTIPNGINPQLITGVFPIADLLTLNDPDLATVVNHIRPVYQPVGNVGITTSAGDTSIEAHLARGGFDTYGEGIKIGVISDSYNNKNGAQTGINNDDLPGKAGTETVTVIQDYPAIYGSRSDEGRAMMEIAHDLAPKSSLAFRTGFISAGDCAYGVIQLKDAGCHVIVDDVTYITEPFFKKGIITQAVDIATAAGVTYFTSAGNFGQKSYTSTFTPGVEVASGVYAHDFGTGKRSQTLRLKPGQYTIALQWQDEVYSLGTAAGTLNDLDIYLIDPTGYRYGFNRNNLGGDPIEVLSFRIDATKLPPGTSEIDAELMVVKAGTLPGAVNPKFKYVIFRGEASMVDGTAGQTLEDKSTIVAHANAANAISVGAVLWSNTPGYGKTPTIASFSSTGGTPVYSSTGSVTILQKPDLTAPNGVNTTVDIGLNNDGSGSDNDIFKNFYGTSAAAPHAAAAAALVLSARKKYYTGTSGTLTPAQLKPYLFSSAVPMEPQGLIPGTSRNQIAGYGLVQPDKAIRQFANPKPQIYSLTYDDGVVPGEVAFTVHVLGNYLSSASELYFDGKLINATVNQELNTISGSIPKFSGNPPLWVYTDPHEGTNGTDGGQSNTLTFYGERKDHVKIKVDDKIKKYGEPVPTLTATITINGLTLQQHNEKFGTNLTLADIGVDGSKVVLSYNETLNALTNVGNFGATATRTANSNPTTEATLLSKYDYTVENGFLQITKLPVTVVPKSRTMVYGQALTNLEFDYNISSYANVQSTTAIQEILRTSHKKYTADNALAVINNFSATQSNGSALTYNDIRGMNMKVTYQALKNSRKFLVNNGELAPLGSANTFNVFYVTDVASKSVYDYKTAAGTANITVAFTGYKGKAIVSEASIKNGSARVETVDVVNGYLSEMVNGNMGSMPPILNGQLVQLVNGRMVNEQLEPITNGQLVQLVNGQLVQLVNGEFTSVGDNQLVKIPNSFSVGNDAFLKQVNGQLQQLVNGQLVPLVNGQLALVNGQLQQLVNGQLVPLVNGQLVPLVNGQLVQLVNGQLQPLVNGQLVQLVNGQLVQLVNGQLVQLVNGQLQPLVNSGAGATASNTTAVIVDEDDVQIQTGWLGATFGIHMVTGLNVGTQKIIPGVLVNDNFDVSYDLGTLTITPKAITVTADAKTKTYGDADPVFTYKSSGDVAASSFTGTLSRSPGENVGNYAIGQGTLTAGANYSITYVPANLTILAKTLTVTANAVSKTYGDPDPALTFTYIGSVSTPTFTGTLSRAAGANAGVYSITIGNLQAANYTITFVGANFTINKAPLTVTADNKSKDYEAVLPTFTYNIKDKNGQVVTSSISGAATMSTTATQYSLPGNYAINISSGTLTTTNYTYTFVPGTLTINDAGCPVLTHSKFSSFTSTSAAPTSLWLNVEIKVSGQLRVDGDYIMFSGGKITFNNISSSTTVKDLPIKRGIIIAADVGSPTTYFDAAKDMFVTKVPRGFSSTSDIFISGGTVTSATGFTKQNNANTVLKGIFYSNKNFSDQWFYGLAAYQTGASSPTYVLLSDLSPEGSVTTINGTEKSGTPLPWRSFLVPGGSGNGGSQYTGSNSANDNFTACNLNDRSVVLRTSSSLNTNPTTSLESDLTVYPNPSSSRATISFVTQRGGQASIVMYNVAGQKVMEIFKGNVLESIKYHANISTRSLPPGLYLIKLQENERSTIRKLVVEN